MSKFLLSKKEIKYFIFLKLNILNIFYIFLHNALPGTEA